MRYFLIAVTTFLSILGTDLVAVAQTDLLTMDRSRGVLTMAPLLESITPAVISIETTRTDKRPQINMQGQDDFFERFFGRSLPAQPEEYVRRGLGSGVIVDARKGYIITNHHVINNTDEMHVTLSDGRDFEATLIGSDKKTDIAVLQIDAKKLTALPFAKNDAARVGDYVIAIGNPFGLDSTVTSGIISALGRDYGGQDNYADFIQTDAAINQGNSGGALVNSKGELIGMNTAIISRSGGNNGIGFAVPVKMINSVMRQLIAYGEVRRGRIGISIRNIDQNLQQALVLSTREGALINEVSKDSPAERAGLKAGDVVITFNDEKILDSADIRNAVGLVESGLDYEIAFLRDGKKHKVKILVEALLENPDVLDEDDATELPALESFSGAQLRQIPEDLNLRGGNEGIYVATVRPGSKAARAGLRRGDIIREINRQPIDGLRDFKAVIETTSGPYALRIERDGNQIFLALR